MKNIVFVFLVCFCFMSCSVFNRTKTKTKITKVIRIDTVFNVHVDTTTKRTTTYIYDTVRLETKFFKVISFVDTIHKKIIVSAAAKPIKDTIQINQTVTEKKKEVITNKKIPLLFRYFYIVYFSLIVFAFYQIYKLFKK